MTRSVALRAGGVFVVLALLFFILSISGEAQVALAASSISSLTAVFIFILATLVPEQKPAPIAKHRRRHRRS